MLGPSSLGGRLRRAVARAVQRLPRAPWLAESSRSRVLAAFDRVLALAALS